MLHYSSVFSTNTGNKACRVGKCIYTDRHREDFLFLLSGHKCIQRYNNGLARFIHVAGRETAVVYIYVGARFFQFFLAVDFIRTILGKFCFR